MSDQLEESTGKSLPTGERSAPEIFESARYLVDHPESAATLHTVAEMVRRTMRADTTTVASFSLAERTITWKALSGFRSRAADARTEVVIPLRGHFAERAAATDEIMILAGLGLRDDVPGSDFPLHSSEGVRDLALVPLKVRGERLGALVVGYRTAHTFTEDEQQLLNALSEMAALALENARLLETVGTGK